MIYMYCMYKMNTVVEYIKIFLFFMNISTRAVYLAQCSDTYVQ
jgi:hypothetical protein